MKHSIQDLIKIAEGKSTGTIKTTLENEVHRFILSLNIKEGKHRVKNAIIFKAYNEWAVRKVTTHKFFAEFSKFFMQDRTRTCRHYNLNYRPIELLNKIDNMKVKIK